MPRLAGAVRPAWALLLVAQAIASAAHAGDPLAGAVAQARAEARKWQADARLVQIEVTGFGFAIGPSGIPDMSKAGPPKLVMFKFVSAAAPGTVLRANVRINEADLPPAQQQARIAMGYKTLFVDFLPAAAVPFTLSIPASVGIELPQAITRAERDIGAECAKADPTMGRSCSLVQHAEFHMQKRDAGDTTGIPVWTIRFGQHARLHDDVSRVVDASTGQIVARNVYSRFPSGVIPSVRATVAGLRFFLGPPDPPPAAQRSYDDLFFYNAARDIHWELSLVHPAPGRRTSFTVQAVWELPGVGRSFRETPRVFTLEADATASRFTGGANLQGTRTVVTANPLYESCIADRQAERARRERERLPPLPESSPCERTQAVDIRIWSAGGYRVDLIVDGQRVASGSFEMKGKEEIYGQVAARARDRSAPSGGIGYLDARVTALRFFEAGPSAPPRAQRRYANLFAPATRNIAWELALRHEAPGRWLELPLEALLYHTGGGGERVVQRRVLQSAVPADSADTQHWDSFGWDNDYYYDRSGATTPSPRSWRPGVYRVDLFAGGRGRAGYKVASGSFEVR